jgi:C4-dicarboxylate-specific signal transduction histidine kinase
MQQQLNDKEQELLTNQANAHHANKMASLGEMASGMAHEINSPIQEISLIAERVKRRTGKGNHNDTISAMDTIVISAHCASNIIESLRNLSRDSENDDFEPTRLGDVLKDATNISQERYKLNGIDFSIEYKNTNEDTTINCQRLQIAQILVNLINNAFDAVMSYEKKWIQIETIDFESSIVLAVIDSGHGISENIQNKLFNPMFTTKEIGKGTGLGLSISARIAEKHNGTLTVDNTYPHTRFVLTLPKSKKANNNDI